MLPIRAEIDQLKTDVNILIQMDTELKKDENYMRKLVAKYNVKQGDLIEKHLEANRDLEKFKRDQNQLVGIGGATVFADRQQKEEIAKILKEKQLRAINQL